jgi:hypothetical protein
MNRHIAFKLKSVTITLAMMLTCDHVQSGQNVSNQSLADALQNVSCDGDTWVYYGRFANAMQFGMSERVLNSRWPGADFDSLPTQILQSFHGERQDIAEWIECLSNTSLTRVKKQFLYGNPDKKPLFYSVRELASIHLDQVTPSGIIEKKNNATSEERKLLRINGFKAWHERRTQLSLDQRMELWFELARQRQRLNFMVLSLEAEHESAFPLIEDDFMDRGRAADDGLLMEVLSYCRHRRQMAVPFLERFRKGQTSLDILTICDAPGGARFIRATRRTTRRSNQVETVR